MDNKANFEPIAPDFYFGTLLLLAIQVAPDPFARKELERIYKMWAYPITTKPVEK